MNQILKHRNIITKFILFPLYYLLANSPPTLNHNIENSPTSAQNHYTMINHTPNTATQCHYGANNPSKFKSYICIFMEISRGIQYHLV